MKKSFYFQLIISIWFVSMMASCDFNQEQQQEVEFPETEYFQEKEAAIHHYISTEGVEGNVEQIETSQGDTFLLIEDPKNYFFIGQVVSSELGKGYYVVQSGDKVDLSEQTGMAWVFYSHDNQHSYTMIVKEEGSAEFISLNDERYSFTVLEGGESEMVNAKTIPKDRIVVEKAESFQ